MGCPRQSRMSQTWDQGVVGCIQPRQSQPIWDISDLGRGVLWDVYSPDFPGCPSQSGTSQTWDEGGLWDVYSPGLPGMSPPIWDSSDLDKVGCV